MTAEQDWLVEKELVKGSLKALLDLGVPLENARAMANWNITLEYGTFAEVSVFPPPPGPAAVPFNGLRESLRLQFARSAERVNPGQLEGAQLDAGKLYAIFIPNVTELAITSVSFLLNGSPHHVEASAPWDYDGTLFDGSAGRVTFTSGSYEIEADIIDAYGPFSISSSFNVE